MFLWQYKERQYVPKKPTCHPERRLYAKGLCDSCWTRQSRHRSGRAKQSNGTSEPIEYDTIGGRRCIRCRRFLDRTNFLNNRNIQDGLRRVCRNCNNLAKRAHSHRRRAFKQKTSIGKIDYEKLLALKPWRCCLCDAEIGDWADLSFEHLVPLSRGGSHTQENLSLAHRVCNSRKGSKTFEEWRLKLLNVLDINLFIDFVT